MRKINAVLDIVEQDISRMMLDASKLTMPSTRKAEFRCSSLPFCPIRSFLQMSKREDSYRMDFYTGTGTTLHELMQKWMPLTEQAKGRVYGQWACMSCGVIHPPQLMPHECPACRASRDMLRYREVEVSYKGLSGHVDYLYMWSRDQFVLPDFKTTSLIHSRNKYPHNWRDHYPSSPNYIVQLRTYACLLREVYGLNITALMLIFIDRSRTIESEKDFHIVSYPWDEDRHNKWLRKVDKACTNNKLLQRLRRRVEAANEYSDEAVNTLRKMVDNRPCTSEASWNTWMKKGFFKGECELLPACLKGPKATMRAIMRNLEETVK